jgi:hypothetical protein
VVIKGREVIPHAFAEATHALKIIRRYELPSKYGKHDIGGDTIGANDLIVITAQNYLRSPGFFTI